MIFDAKFLQKRIHPRFRHLVYDHLRPVIVVVNGIGRLLVSLREHPFDGTSCWIMDSDVVGRTKIGQDKDAEPTMSVGSYPYLLFHNSERIYPL